MKVLIIIVCTQQVKRGDILFRRVITLKFSYTIKIGMRYCIKKKIDLSEETHLFSFVKNNMKLLPLKNI